ncbi:N-acetylmannosamine kinase [Enterobacteriaceae bacterium YMB-R22]|jgi:N-acylmannosamine kinase|uniref:N-acetylmannosamine kinase n=1 Tax=Tenebrionicola larvae TaxID=2815733 RepID=UPI002010E6CC|nr:N-acetylmannosamine kinase [Tenebrionicola larvae]MBV4411527.1 N-acetylmannosamine kinase [Tenebrionicola larvae]
MITLAIDIGGTKLAAALVDDTLNLFQHRERPTPASKTPDALHAALQALVAPLVTQAQRVAIASTGIIRNGTLLAINPHNLGGLAHFPLVKALETITGLPALAVNDAQAAAWAEYYALRGAYRDMVFLTVSTGVGGGIVSAGRLVTGSGGLAGHFGHTLADPNGPVCGCGRRGCVEAIASGRGISAAAQDDLAGCDTKTIFTHARQNNEQAARLIQRSAQALAGLIADVKAMSDCQCVVIGGSVGLAEGYLARVKTCLAREPAAYQVALQPAYYRHNAGLLGAALLARREELW